MSASGLEGTIAVVACDKPPVGTLAALLEHNRPAIIMSDGTIHPGVDSVTKEKIDIISGFQVAGDDDEEIIESVEEDHSIVEELDDELVERFHCLLNKACCLNQKSMCLFYFLNFSYQE